MFAQGSVRSCPVGGRTVFSRAMKSLRWAALLLLSVLPGLWATTEPVVCVVTIREEISRNTTFLIRRALREVEQQNAKALIVEMDTNGGSVPATEDILPLLQHSPVKTYTFVNTKAYSAGAIIACATGKIFMAPGSVIGAATPILLGMQEIGAAEREKMNSAIRALVRTTAQDKGHNPSVFEAMVDKELGLTVAGTNLCEKGKLLTLTNEEAARKFGKPATPLLSAGTVNSMNDLLQAIHLTGAQIVEVKPYGFEVLARWITVISPLLIIIGLVAIFVELKAPGLGLPTVVAIVAFGIYFLGFIAAGLAGWEEVAVFAIGLVLLLLEIFVIPGFGIAGISGIALIVTSLLLAMVEHWPGMMWPSWNQWEVAVVRLGIGLIGAVVVGAILARWLPETLLFQRFELSKTLSAAEGYTSSRGEAKSLLGAEGIAETVLRPAGKGRFGEKLVDVVTEGDFIPKNERIKIVAVEGSRVVVTKWT
jgi:membrane-bound serine protease (ClpP class)